MIYNFIDYYTSSDDVYIYFYTSSDDVYIV